MAKPVVITISGGKPVINTPTGTPATPVDGLGMSITLVDALGTPMALINLDGSEYSAEARAPGTNSALHAYIEPIEGEVGDTFTANVEGDLGSPAGTRTYQWKLDGVNISGATAATYVAEDDGALTVVVTVTNATDDASDTSDAVTVTPAVLFIEDFSNGLSLVTPGAPNTGTFYPNWNWMDRSLSWHDFAAKTTMINPNSPGLSHLNPFSVVDGILTINCFRTPPEDTDAIEAVIWQSGTDAKDWLGGMLFTRQTFTEGWIQYRLRCPNPGKGMWPGWWMYGALDGSADYAHSKLEIDLSEVFGWSDGSPFSTHLHFQNDGNGTERPSVEVGFYDYDTTDFHVWSVDRQATYLRFYYDDVLYAEITGDDATWFAGVPMRMIVGNAAGADWFAGIGSSDTDETTPSPMRLEIDYLRVHATKPAFTVAPSEAPVISVAGGDGEFVITLAHANFVPRATSYLLEVSDNGTTGWSTVADDLGSRVPTGFQWTDGGYSNGVTKHYRLTPKNSAGSGPASDVESDATDGGDLIPSDWASDTGNWVGAFPSNWSMTAGKIVTTDGNWNSSKLILASPALVGVEYEWTVNVVLGSGGANMNFSDSGNDPPGGHELVNGLNTFSLTMPEFAASRALLIVQSSGFELTSWSVVPA